MAYLEPLVLTNQLRQNFLAKESLANLTFQYDDAFDALMVKFVPRGPHAVHYLYGDFAALVEPENLEIVGFWFENFKSKFLARHPEQKRVWTVFENTDPQKRTDIFLGLLNVALKEASQGLEEPQSKAELVHELETMFD
jgi:hypothetical protein